MPGKWPGIFRSLVVRRKGQTLTSLFGFEHVLGFHASTIRRALGVGVAIDELDDRHGRHVPITEPGLEDADIAALTLGVARAQHFEKLRNMASCLSWAAAWRRACRSPRLASVTSFSTTGRSSFALGSVVLICSCSISEPAMLQTGPFGVRGSGSGGGIRERDAFLYLRFNALSGSRALRNPPCWGGIAQTEGGAGMPEGAKGVFWKTKPHQVRSCLRTSWPVPRCCRAASPRYPYRDAGPFRTALP
jgi:hypothetical protein